MFVKAKVITYFLRNPIFGGGESVSALIFTGPTAEDSSMVVVFDHTNVRGVPPLQVLVGFEADLIKGLPAAKEVGTLEVLEGVAISLWDLAHARVKAFAVARDLQTLVESEFKKP